MWLRLIELFRREKQDSVLNSFKKYIVSDGFLELVTHNHRNISVDLWLTVPISRFHDDYSYFRKYSASTKGCLYSSEDFRLICVSFFNAPQSVDCYFQKKEISSFSKVIIQPSPDIDEFYLTQTDVQMYKFVIKSSNLYLQIRFEDIAIIESKEDIFERVKMDAHVIREIT